MRIRLKRLFNYFSGYPIHLKIYVIIVAAIVSVALISLLVIRISVTDTMSVQLDERAKSISGDVAARTGDLLLTNNIYAMQSLVNDTINNYNDLEYVFILNEDNEVIVDTYPNHQVSTDIINANRVASDEYNHLITFQSEAGVIRDAAAPVVKGMDATVRVGLRDDSLEEAISSVTLQIITFLILLIVVSLVVVMKLTRVITKPIDELVGLTNRVAKGEMTARITNYPSDEIGDLTESFHDMLNTLEHTEAEKENYVNQIITRNRELMLLNDLSDHPDTTKDFNAMMNRFVRDLVLELKLDSAAIEATIIDQKQTFSYRAESCPEMNSNCLITCDCDCEKKQANVFNVFSIFAHHNEIGQIKICSPEQLDTYSHKILDSIANHLGTVIENNELTHEIKKKEEIRQMLLEKILTVQEDERKRIARELHDQTGHALSSILLGLKMLEDAKTPEEVTKQIEALRKLTHQSIEDIHDLAWQLRPTILDKFGLKTAIERYIQDFQQKLDIDYDVLIKGIDTIRLTPEMETAIFRIVQESLTNIFKYAEANSVSVILLRNHDMISVIIEDDGVGFDVEKMMNKDPSKFNLGLHGMQERTSLLGGTFEIESEKGRGTAIMVKLPMSSERGEADYENTYYAG
ncbi:sensor histidine kinase [Salisediminibacterium selenitireducens]|uniref:histidine kinase n=1 Tax=Bacillus selenitireducens (strain ATCC 700615 / DSM 15326 / MLS10) TaxID=439292 RepID=D6XXR6_BACIE|nr:histidine kinase [Salisediminibacterium selenitireducens]ADI00109.1 integral membrane sensor signal transduction histidine kinase [[Bacillus] selenitireducens MLS10]